jgi:hypothetical protein
MDDLTKRAMEELATWRIGGKEREELKSKLQRDLEERLGLDAEANNGGEAEGGSRAQDLDEAAVRATPAATIWTLGALWESDVLRREGAGRFQAADLVGGGVGIDLYPRDELGGLKALADLSRDAEEQLRRITRTRNQNRQSVRDILQKGAEEFDEGRVEDEGPGAGPGGGLIGLDVIRTRHVRVIP